MKKLLRLLPLAVLATAAPARASHIIGAEIRYAAEGSKYRIYVTTYGECGVGAGPTTSAPVQITGCGATLTRSMPRISLDTTREIFCASATVGCGLSAANRPYVKAVYSDTVTLTPCAQWKMVYTECCRPTTISNLSGNPGASLYIEAMLNNSVAPNSSPKTAADPALLINGLTATTVPIVATDVEGDSIGYSVIAARGVFASPLNYASGYSAANPLGATGLVLNAGAGRLMLQPTALGQYVLAMRTADYRGGTLVGYSERDWLVATASGASPKVPLHAASSNFTVASCPGQASSLTLTFSDSVATDSVVVTASGGPGVTWPITVTGGAAVGSASPTISWTTPSTLNPTTTPFYYIRLRVRDNACALSGAAWYDIIVRTAPCNTDTVWAGDADANKVVDLYDPLAIAVAFGKTGSVRPGASTAWVAQPCPNWTTSFSNGVNHKHADCDGNGTVASADLTAVTTNYALTHPRPGGGDDDWVEPAKTAGVPDLRFDKTGVSAHRGSTVTVPLRLGDAASPMLNLYGLAARIQVVGITPSTAPTITYPTASWLGTAGNTLRFAIPAGGTAVDWAYARTTGASMASGSGALAHVSIAIPASTPVGTQMILRITQPRLINAVGTVLTDYNVLSDTLTVVAEQSIGSPASPVAAAFVVPNPGDRFSLLHLRLDRPQTVALTMTDAVGRAVWTQRIYIGGAGTADLSLADIDVTAGMYFIRVQPVDGGAGKVVKWVRD